MQNFNIIHKCLNKSIDVGVIRRLYPSLFAGLAGKSTNLYTYAHNSPLLYADPSGRLYPALIFGGAVVGAVTNTLSHVATNLAKGQPVIHEIIRYS